MAEWLGRALQKLLHQFESGRDLEEKLKVKSKNSKKSFAFGFFIVGPTPVRPEHSGPLKNDAMNCKNLLKDD